VVATTTPDLVFPALPASCSQAGETNASRLFPDLQACAAVSSTHERADQFIKTGAAKHVLVIGAETLSRITDWNDRGNCIGGDGAGAVVLGASNGRASSLTHIHADGRHKELLRTTTGPSTGLPSRRWLRMEATPCSRMAVTRSDRIVDKPWKPRPAEIDIDAGAAPGQHPHHFRHAKKLGMSMDTSSPPVPATAIPRPRRCARFDVAVRDGRISRGQTLINFWRRLSPGALLLKY